MGSIECFGEVVVVGPIFANHAIEGALILSRSASSAT